jgi:Phage integrase family
MTPKAFHALFGRIGARAKMPFPVHPHMLRHGCGYALANAGHDTRALQAWLGHKTSSTRCATRSWRRTGSRTFGDSRFVAIGVTSAAGRSSPRPFRTIKV